MNSKIIFVMILFWAIPAQAQEIDDFFFMDAQKVGSQKKIAQSAVTQTELATRQVALLERLTLAAEKMAGIEPPPPPPCDDTRMIDYVDPWTKETRKIKRPC